MDRRDFDPGKPRQQIVTDGCQTSCAFHPSSPALLGVGSYTGRVAVMNLALEAPGEAASGDGLHSEPITGLAWVSSAELMGGGSSSQAHDMVLSTALDGRMVLWSYGGSTLEPFKVCVERIYILGQAN